MPRSSPEPPARVLRVETLGSVPYERGLELQTERVLDVRSGGAPDTLFLLEHPPVITLGSSSDPAHVLLDEADRASRGIELHETGRGGDVTLHVPGQLVGYPILDLKPDRQDLHRYLRDLEWTLIQTLGAFGITAGREPGYTGVWCEGGKIGAIGVRVSSGWITSHGFALNVEPDLSLYETIVPCGIPDRPVTSMARELGRAPAIAEVGREAARSLAARFGYRLEDVKF